MKSIYLLSFLFLFHISVYSQWDTYWCPYAGILLSVAFSGDSSSAAAVGWVQYGGSRGVYTTNAGSMWLPSVMPATSSTITVQHIMQNTYYASSHTIILGPLQFKNSNIKADFMGMPGEDVPRSPGFEFNNVIMSTSVGNFFKTTDGGQNWFDYGTLPDSVTSLVGLYFLDANTGYVTTIDSLYVGKFGTIKTTNAGDSWVKQVLPTTSGTLYSIWFVDQNTGFSTGSYHAAYGVWQGLIFKTTNGGAVWDMLVIPDVNNFSKIYFANSTTGFAVGILQDNRGAIYKTTNSGLNWNSLNDSLPDQFIQGVKFVPGTGTGIFYGQDYPNGSCHIYKTTDYGSTFSRHDNFPYANFLLEDAYLVNDKRWYVVGGNVSGMSVILSTTTGGEPIGIKSIDNRIPKTFSLLQNYPNPFNPLTRIKFEIRPPLYPLLAKEGTAVLLTLYDVTGCEVTTLVNQQLKPGSYEVEWDGSNYSSGIYFYRLITGDFTQTKKMALLK